MDYFSNILLFLKRVTSAKAGDLFQACLQSYRMHVLWSDDIQKLLHTYRISYLRLVRKDNNLHYTSYVKLFRLFKEEKDLIRSSFVGRREHFVNL